MEQESQAEKPAEAATTAERSAVFVYVGLRRQDEDTWSHGYVEVVDGKFVQRKVPYGEVDNVRFWKKPLAPGRPGSMFDVTVEGEKSVYTGGQKAPKYTRQWPVQSDVVMWQVMHEAELVSKCAHAQQKKETGRRLPWETLQPFNRAFYKMDSPGRQALIARVISVVMDGTAKETKRRARKK